VSAAPLAERSINERRVRGMDFVSGVLFSGFEFMVLMSETVDHACLAFDLRFGAQPACG
jgi:hypothetical protein